MAKVAIIGLVAAFLLFYVITSPDQAASIVSGGWDKLTDIAHGVGRFVDKLAS